MLDGRLLVDAHVHPPRLPTLKAAWHGWAEQFGPPGWRAVFDRDGAVIPGRSMRSWSPRASTAPSCSAGYRPKVTGIQPVEDLLPIIAQPRTLHVPRERQPAPALPGRRGTGEAGRDGRGRAGVLSGARRVLRGRPDALPRLPGLRGRGWPVSCTAAPVRSLAPTRHGRSGPVQPGAQGFPRADGGARARRRGWCYESGRGPGLASGGRLRAVRAAAQELPEYYQRFDLAGWPAGSYSARTRRGSRESRATPAPWPSLMSAMTPWAKSWGQVMRIYRGLAAAADPGGPVPGSGLTGGWPPEIF